MLHNAWYFLLPHFTIMHSASLFCIPGSNIWSMLKLILLTWASLSFFNRISLTLLPFSYCTSSQPLIWKLPIYYHKFALAIIFSFTLKFSYHSYSSSVTIPTPAYQSGYHSKFHLWVLSTSKSQIQFLSLKIFWNVPIGIYRFICTQPSLIYMSHIWNIP